MAGDGILTLYAQVEDANTANTNALGTWVMRPDDPAWPTSGGVPQWRQLTGSAASSYVTCTGGASTTNQDWYDLYMHVNPLNDRELLPGPRGSVQRERQQRLHSADSRHRRQSDQRVRDELSSYGKVHPDEHGFAFVELGSGDPNYGKWILVGNDGGIYLNTNSGSASELGLDQQGRHQHQPVLFRADRHGLRRRRRQRQLRQSDRRQAVAPGGMQDNGYASWDSSRADLQWTARGVGRRRYVGGVRLAGREPHAGYWINEVCKRRHLNCAPRAPAARSAPAAEPGLGGPQPSRRTGRLRSSWTSSTARTSSAGTWWSAATSVYASVAYARRLGLEGRRSCRPAKAPARSSASTSCPARRAEAGRSRAPTTGAGAVRERLQGASCTRGRPTPPASLHARTARRPGGRSTPPRSRRRQRSVPQPGDRGRWLRPGRPQDRLCGGVRIRHQHPERPPVTSSARSGTATSKFTVQDKCGNLPDVPFNTVAANPNNPNQVFAGSHWGFYYTDDITQASPTWVRYMDGPLPNAPIYHFSLDRGPQSGSPSASTTLAAFTYGRGVYAIKLPADRPELLHQQAAGADQRAGGRRGGEPGDGHLGRLGDGRGDAVHRCTVPRAGRALHPVGTVATARRASVARGATAFVDVADLGRADVLLHRPSFERRSAIR